MLCSSASCISDNLHNNFNNNFQLTSEVRSPQISYMQVVSKLNFQISLDIHGYLPKLRNLHHKTNTYFIMRKSYMITSIFLVDYISSNLHSTHSHWWKHKTKFKLSHTRLIINKVGRITDSEAKCEHQQYNHRGFEMQNLWFIPNLLTMLERTL